MMDQQLEQNAGSVPLESRWSYRISILAGLLDRQSARRFSKHELNLVQWRILMRVVAVGPCSISELLPLAAVDRALVSREAAALQRRGLLKIFSDLTDKRRKIVELTAAGRAKHAAVLPETIARHKYLDSALTPEERLVFARAIDKMKARIIDDLDSGGGGK